MLYVVIVVAIFLQGALSLDDAQNLGLTGDVSLDIPKSASLIEPEKRNIHRRYQSYYDDMDYDDEEDDDEDEEVEDDEEADDDDEEEEEEEDITATLKTKKTATNATPHKNSYYLSKKEHPTTKKGHILTTTAKPIRPKPRTEKLTPLRKRKPSKKLSSNWLKKQATEKPESKNEIAILTPEENKALQDFLKSPFMQCVKEMYIWVEKNVSIARNEIEKYARFVIATNRWISKRYARFLRKKKQ